MAVWGAFTAGAVLTDAELDAGTGGAWTTYTPTWTNLTKGAATIVAKYRQLGRIVITYIAITFAADTSVSGLIGISRPVTGANATDGGTTAAIFDSGVGFFAGHILGGTTTRWDLYAVNAASTASAALTATSSSVPMTWTTNDRFYFTSVYEAAADGAA